MFPVVNLLAERSWVTNVEAHATRTRMARRSIAIKGEDTEGGRFCAEVVSFLPLSVVLHPQSVFF